MTSVFVSSAIANKPKNGGNAWAVFSWVNGLRNLGLDVFFLEQIDPASIQDATGQPCTLQESMSAAYFQDVCRFFGMVDHSALVCGEETLGLSRPELFDRAADASLLVNITGHLDHPDLLRCFRRKAYLDFDPGYTQFWHASGIAGARLKFHDVFFTLAENIGSPRCSIPAVEFDWRTVRQPVVLGDWPFVGGHPGRFTTVATWRTPYGRLQFEGKDFGQKLHEFRKIVETPRLCPDTTFELALDIHPGDHADVDLFGSQGWSLIDNSEVATPEGFQAYVRASGAELSSAQPVYVETQSGWFSDRSVRYLASGKPVVVQDTGFGDYLPLQEGLFAYRTQEDIVNAVASINADYPRHSATARRIAEEHFNSDRIIPRFLEEASI